jgi:hypothetical protein
VIGFRQSDLSELDGMETIIFTADITVLILVLYYSLRHERRPDEPEAGLFRIRDPMQADKKKSDRK